MLKLIRCVLAPLAVALAAGPAFAASGVAEGVNPDAEARGNSTRTLVVGADVFIGERIVTGPSGQVQIRFSDNTELVVGPSSALLLEDYLLREDGSAGKFAINALSGTFRFVTGQAPKDRYEIKTPTGTIGVRGTSLDFFSSATLMAALLYDGAIRLCNKAGKCVDLSDVCDVGQADTADALLIGHPDQVSGAEREALRSWFIYALSQRSLLRPYRVNNAERCLRRPAGGGASEGSIGDTGGGPEVVQSPRQTPPLIFNSPGFTP